MYLYLYIYIYICVCKRLHIYYVYHVYNVDVDASLAELSETALSFSAMCLKYQNTWENSCDPRAYVAKCCQRCLWLSGSAHLLSSFGGSKNVPRSTTFFVTLEINGTPSGSLPSRLHRTAYLTSTVLISSSTSNRRIFDPWYFFSSTGSHHKSHQRIWASCTEMPKVNAKVRPPRIEATWNSSTGTGHMVIHGSQHLPIKCMKVPEKNIQQYSTFLRVISFIFLGDGQKKTWNTWGRTLTRPGLYMMVPPAVAPPSSQKIPGSIGWSLVVSAPCQSGPPVLFAKVRRSDGDMGMDQYLLIPFLGGWTSINPSYFDVNYRGTIGFDTLPYVARDAEHDTTGYPIRYPWYPELPHETMFTRTSSVQKICLKRSCSKLKRTRRGMSLAHQVEF